MPAKISDPKSHLLSKISKTPNGCWEWNGYLNESGYGRTYKDTRRIYAHRLSYELFCGPVSDDEVVCHKCDNPKCVNPKHLFLGSRADNIRDAVSKKRNAKGERMGSSKLTDGDVRAIRSSGDRSIDLAEKYGVHENMIYYIRHRKNWKHI